jgi:hypothetical protein
MEGCGCSVSETKSEQQITVLIAYSAADDSNKLPPLKVHVVLRILNLPTKYDASTYFWMTTMVFEYHLRKLASKWLLKIKEPYFFIAHCAIYLKNTIFLRNLGVLFLPAYSMCQLHTAFRFGDYSFIQVSL